MAANGKIHLTRLSHVIYEHSDLQVWRSFAEDFGLKEVPEQSDEQTIYYYGYGKDPYVYVAHPASQPGEKKFIGAGFCARSEGDFKAACQMEGAKVIDPSPAPGGGKMVRLRDPNGYEMRLLWSQKEQELPDHGISVLTSGTAVNGALDKRRKGANYFARRCLNIDLHR